MQTRPGIEVASQTDVGCRRENNEDFLSYWEPESDTEFQRKGRLAVIADGMGGYEGGQEASRLAVETVLDIYDQDGSADPRDSLVRGFQEAHDRIKAYADSHPDLQGMGTTCTALAVLDRKLFFAHIGDSRLYLVRGGKISRLTADHSYVGRLVASGVLRSEEAESHPQRHILTAALGAGNELLPDTPEDPVLLEASDALILCTDGLWSVVHDEELLNIVTRYVPAAACHELVRLARERGGPDNITVQVLKVGNNGNGNSSRKPA
jgi:protein phosphatase